MIVFIHQKMEKERSAPWPQGLNTPQGRDHRLGPVRTGAQVRVRL
ncbi:hypothetical protein W822_07885 [Advenella kashmirensis W13003]|uniref:Uncharacterized protein n=1 Tax=Advenella kashmirensis W13003 TaxID=1424334 RepID=V8QWS6_9BURK|nr:hypothetical protein W822_07885 [Advenella kashmirensis W13003]